MRLQIEKYNNDYYNKVIQCMPFLKDYFFVKRLNNTQLECKFYLPNYLFNFLPQNWKDNIYDKRFILDTSRNNLATIQTDGGIVDGVPKRSSYFYSVYIFFNSFYEFQGLGLTQQNKALTDTNINKNASNIDIILTGVNQANFWSDFYVPIMIWYSATEWTIGEGKRKDANTLTINTENYGFNITSNGVKIYQIIQKKDRHPLNSSNKSIIENSDLWLHLTSRIRIDGSGNIETWEENNDKMIEPQFNEDYVGRRIVNTTNGSFVMYNLNEDIPPSQIEVQLRLLVSVATSVSGKAHIRNYRQTYNWNVPCYAYVGGASSINQILPYGLVALKCDSTRLGIGSYRE